MSQISNPMIQIGSLVTTKARNNDKEVEKNNVFIVLSYAFLAVPGSSIDRILAIG
jgi:hypothetical protein